jgi:hypothetical protein
LHRGGERFDTLGGLQGLKAFCLRSMRRQGHSNPLKRPKGCLLLSPPGCGKSQFAKCLGRESDRPTPILDIGSLMGQDQVTVVAANSGVTVEARFAAMANFPPQIILSEYAEADITVACRCRDAGPTPANFANGPAVADVANAHWHYFGQVQVSGFGLPLRLEAHRLRR